MTIINLEKIEAIQDKIKNAPDAKKDEVKMNKQTAINHLKDDIDSMLNKGYTIDAIAKFLTENGLEISTSTLKSYLNRLNSKTKKTTKVKNKKNTDTILENFDAKKILFAEKINNDFPQRDNEEV